MTDTPLLLRSDHLRRRVIVTGVVQGVGFRPFVHVLATELGLAGFVGNNSGAVFVEVQGGRAQLDEFARRLRAEAPPLARISSVSTNEIATETSTSGFRIVASQTVGGHHTDSARCRGVRPLHRRIVRSPGPALPAPVHHLHQLRATVHRHPHAAL